MKSLRSSTLLGAILSAALLSLGGCASTPVVDASNRDTTGAYEGVWLGKVSKPRASKELLPGNWYMTCEWEPFEIYLVVEDGSIQLGDLDEKAFISGEGQFGLSIGSGSGKMIGGVMPGNSQIINEFSGKLSGDKPVGKFLQYDSYIGSGGCRGKITFSRYQESNA